MTSKLMRGLALATIFTGCMIGNSAAQTPQPTPASCVYIQQTSMQIFGEVASQLNQGVPSDHVVSTIMQEVYPNMNFPRNLTDAEMDNYPDKVKQLYFIVAWALNSIEKNNSQPQPFSMDSLTQTFGQANYDRCMKELGYYK